MSSQNIPPIKREIHNPMEAQNPGNAANEEAEGEIPPNVDVSYEARRILAAMIGAANAGFSTFARVEAPDKTPVDIFPFELVNGNTDVAVTEDIRQRHGPEMRDLLVSILEGQLNAVRGDFCCTVRVMLEDVETVVLRISEGE